MHGRQRIEDNISDGSPYRTFGQSKKPCGSAFGNQLGRSDEGADRTVVHREAEYEAQRTDNAETRPCLETCRLRTAAQSVHGTNPPFRKEDRASQNGTSFAFSEGERPDPSWTRAFAPKANCQAFGSRLWRTGSRERNPLQSKGIELEAQHP